MVLQIGFWISKLNGKKEIYEIQIWISQLKSTTRTDFSEVKSINLQISHLIATLVSPVIPVILQSWTKVLGHFCIPGVFSGFTPAQSLPSHHKQSWTHSSLSASSLSQMCPWKSLNFLFKKGNGPCPLFEQKIQGLSKRGMDPAPLSSQSF